MRGAEGQRAARLFTLPALSGCSVSPAAPPPSRHLRASIHPHILPVSVLLYMTIQPKEPWGTGLGAALRGNSTQTIFSPDKRAETATRRVCASVCVCLCTFVVLLISPEL